MKFASILLGSLVTILLIQPVSPIYTVKLKPSYTEVSLIFNYCQEKRSKLLLNLKLLQINMRQPIFLDTRSITLHQQVLSQKRLATYYGDIGIGNHTINNHQSLSSSYYQSLSTIGKANQTGQQQYFRMLFDTGSCEFWIPSIDCQTQRCLTHRRYQRSSSFKLYNNAEMSIQYLSGKVEGKMATEYIKIGDMEIPS